MLNRTFFHQYKYRLLAIYFLLLQLLILYRNYIFKENVYIVYYCDHIPLLFAVGFFFKNMNLVKGLINIGLIAQLFFLFGLLGKLFFDMQTRVSIEALFNYSLFSIIVTLLMHLFTAFPALLFTYKEKTEHKALLYSIIYAVFLYISTLLFTPINYDMNCVFNGCGISLFKFELFTKFWLPIILIGVILPSHYFQRWLRH